VYGEGDVTVLWNQAVNTDTEVTANRPDIKIKNKKETTCTLIDLAIPAEKKCRAKGGGKEVKIQEVKYRDTTNVETEIHDCTSYNWSHWNSSEKLKEKSGSCTGKTFDRFTTADSSTWNITHNTESTAVTGSVSGGGHRWFKGSTGKKRSVTRDNDNKNNNGIFIIFTM
jgi:hypothetical protein